jgi:linoleoyl-CoA desaturase
LAHVVEHTEFEVVGAMDSKQIENEWAIHQIKTTANFAPKDKIVSWFVGGLNYQVEHHLFPRVSHIHYPAISKIVSDTCARHNLPYNKYTTMSAAVASHFRMMKQLGKKPVIANPRLELARA